MVTKLPLTHRCLFFAEKRKKNKKTALKKVAYMAAFLFFGYISLSLDALH